MNREPLRSPDPTSPTQLRELFDNHNFRPRRALGQTFLVDANILRNIIAAAALTGDEPVLEIGAGAGAVTRELARAAPRVVAVEIDLTLIAILGETVGDAAEVVQADVLALDWQHLLGRAQRGRWVLVANLPYAITGPTLLRLLEAREWVARMVVMVQREVAERLVAPPGTRTRGLLSVLLQAFFDMKLIARVPRTCFWPQPRVDSAVLTLYARRPPPVSSSLEPTFRQVVRAAFSTRRKILPNALANASDLGLSREAARALLCQCGIEERRRAETLTEEEFLHLAQAIACQCEEAQT